MPTSNDDKVASALRVLRTGTCPSLSGKSKLTYEFGLDEQTAWHVRIAKSSGAGFFSKDWFALEHVQRVLEKNGAKPITCHTLSPIFKGKSVNTAGFLLAALKHVGLVQNSADNPRVYELLDGKAFFAELQAAAKEVKPVANVTKSLSPKKKVASRGAKA